MRATQLKTQASSEWAGTWDWTNSTDRSGSTPQATISAALARVFRRSAAGSQGSVIAWRSTTQ
jgi:hypothetical protein